MTEEMEGIKEQDAVVAEDSASVLPEESSEEVIVEPHVTGLTVWDIPSPIERGAGFKIKVGVKCLANCNLTGKQVEVYNHEGEQVATALLGDAPYSDKIDLHWAEVELFSPDTEGYYKWEVTFPEPGLELPHREVSQAFGFSTVGPAECELTLEVINLDGNTPIKNAHVTMRPNLYRGTTDESGVAKIRVARGEYKLVVWAKERVPRGIKYAHLGVLHTTRGREYRLYVPEANQENREFFQTTIKVDGDMAIRVELVGVIEPPEVDNY